MDNNEQSQPIVYLGSDALLPSAEVQVQQQHLFSFRDRLTRTYLDGLKVPSVERPASPPPDLLKLITFSEIRFRKPEDLQTGMQSLLTAISRYGLPFIFLLRRTEAGIYHLHMGLCGKQQDRRVDLQNSFAAIPAAVRGFLPGCRFEDMDSIKAGAPRESKRSVWREISNLGACRILTGIPSKKQVKASATEPVEGIEKLADSSQYPFAVLVHAEPIPRDIINDLRTSVEETINEVHKLGKSTRQMGMSAQESHGDSFSRTKTENFSTSQTQTNGESRQVQGLSGLKTVLDNVKTVWHGGEKSTFQQQTSSAESEQHSHGTSDGETSSFQRSQGLNMSRNTEEIEKSAQNIEAILERHLKRFELGSGAGFWQCLTSVFADNPIHADEIANLFQGMLSGETSGDDPIRVIAPEQNITFYNAPETVLPAEAEPHPFGRRSPEARQLTSGLFTQLTTRELAQLTSLPQHELPGLYVEELVEYGRNWLTRDQADETAAIDLGCLIDRNQLTENTVQLSRERLQRHCFVSGATGSGKSTTVKHLLCRLWQDCRIPFMVIEPVKSEYQRLREQLGDDLRFFRLGEADFSLNPFALEESDIPLSSHLDMLKATFNASLGMYSSMPFILEHILYTVYKERGWALDTGKNRHLEKLQRVGFTRTADVRRLCYPLLGETVPLVKSAIREFFGDAQTDYSGSLTGALHARLSSLVQGAKGRVFNRNAARSFTELLQKPCVIELSNFSDNDEKAFVMALLMTRLYEHRQAEERNRQKNLDEGGEAPSLDTLRHVLVIEEAHRLLARPSPTGEHSAQGRQKGVEVFADILAEIRSYGQGLVIVDQIPSKLIPDVLRNTDIKIAHRIVDKEDRELIGATMNLEEKQIRELARLAPGESCVYFSGLPKALNVMIGKSERLEEDMEEGSPAVKAAPSPSYLSGPYQAGTLLLDGHAVTAGASLQAISQALRTVGITQWTDMEAGIIAFGELCLAWPAQQSELRQRVQQTVDLLCRLAMYLKNLLQDDEGKVQAYAAELANTLSEQEIVRLLDAHAQQHSPAYRAHREAFPGSEAEDMVNHMTAMLAHLRGGLPGPQICLERQYAALAGLLDAIPADISDIVQAAVISRLLQGEHIC